MNYSEAREYLKEIGKLGSVLGLDSIKKLLELMGNPEKRGHVVHVAGTNGKGSTSSFLQSILIEAGYKVGRYSSPAVFEEREIIRINDEYIEENQFAEIVTFIKEKCGEMTQKGFPHPTGFEVETAMAFEYFARNKCDIAIIECGMGGKTDATNVCEEVLCSIITTISLDHVCFLGDTIEKIATIKSGIIKENCPVVISGQVEEAAKVIENACERKRSDLIIAGQASELREENFVTEYDYLAGNQKKYHIHLNLLGTYQIKNSITAIEAALELEKQGFHLEKYIEIGIQKAKWQGRLEIISEQPLFVIDGAHNPGAVAELKNSIDLYFTNKKITFIMGVLADKDFHAELEMIGGYAKRIITLTPNNERALKAEELKDIAKQYNDNVCSAKNIDEAVSMALDSVNSHEADMILAFGSLSYLGNLKIAAKAVIR